MSFGFDKENAHKEWTMIS